jgi:hypothetical protein
LFVRVSVLREPESKPDSRFRGTIAGCHLDLCGLRAQLEDNVERFDLGDLKPNVLLGGAVVLKPAAVTVTEIVAARSDEMQ